MLSGAFWGSIDGAATNKEGDPHLVIYHAGLSGVLVLRDFLAKLEPLRSIADKENYNRTLARARAEQNLPSHQPTAPRELTSCASLLSPLHVCYVTSTWAISAAWEPDLLRTGAGRPG